MLLAITIAAACAVLLSEMPRMAAWPLAFAALACGAWQAWHEARKLPREIVILPPGARSTVDGETVDVLTVGWRGPIAILGWCDGNGRRRRHVFWPDTLPAARRRELRLAAPAPLAARAPASMAP